jgi:enterochelin esterase family protein
MKKVLLQLLALASTTAMAQTIHPFTQKWTELSAISAIGNEQERLTALNTYWETLKAKQQVPLAIGDSVAFLYRGPAKTVGWVGDFNFFGGGGGPWKGTQLPGTDLWYYKASFPKDARLDYKLLLNDTAMVLDSVNGAKQYSGAGGGTYNSELRMPDFKTEQWTVPQNVAKGNLSDNIKINSKALGYDLQYKVYTPSGYASQKDLPVLFITDGHEYADDRMGALVTVTDNLIAAKKIKPLVLVFVDPREPSNLSNNKREQEFLMNENYLKFYRQELVPAIETAYKVKKSPDARGILGTSFGGVNSTYFALNAPDVFRMVAINSPAYWARPQLLEQLITKPKLPVKVFLSTGANYDGGELTRIARAAFQLKGNQLHYIEVNQGHSWGQWRTLMDDMLQYFFAVK